MSVSPESMRRRWEARVLRSLSLPSIPETKPGTLLAVLKHVAEYCRLRDGECWASQQTMATELGLSVSTLRRSLKALEVIGVLTLERKSRGQGRVTHNHYSIVWDKLATYSSAGQADQADQPATDERPRHEQSSTVEASTAHRGPQEQTEKKQNTTATTLDGLLMSIAESVERLLQSLVDRLAAMTMPAMMVAPSAPVRLDDDWRAVQRAAAAAGVEYAYRAAECCRDRGEVAQQVTDRINAFTGTAKQLAKHLIHGAGLPERKVTASQVSTPVTAESLWEQYCGRCEQKGVDKFADENYAVYRQVCEKHGLQPAA